MNLIVFPSGIGSKTRVVPLSNLEGGVSNITSKIYLLVVIGESSVPLLLSASMECTFPVLRYVSSTSVNMRVTFFHFWNFSEFLHFAKHNKKKK